MKINVSYTSAKHYSIANISQWLWMFRKYTYVKGFICRIFGVYLNVRESNATEKLIDIARQQGVRVTNERNSLSR